MGKLVSKERTKAYINGQYAYLFHFEYETKSGEKQKTIAKTHLTHTLEEDARQPLLYDAIAKSFPGKIVQRYETTCRRSQDRPNRKWLEWCYASLPIAASSYDCRARSLFLVLVSQVTNLR